MYAEPADPARDVSGPFSLIRCVQRTKDAVEKVDLVSPVFMRPTLSFGKEEGFSRVKASDMRDQLLCLLFTAADIPPDVGISAVFPCYLNDPIQSQEIERSPAGLEHQKMWSDEQ